VRLWRFHRLSGGRTTRTRGRHVVRLPSETACEERKTRGAWAATHAQTLADHDSSHDHNRAWRGWRFLLLCWVRRQRQVWYLLSFRQSWRRWVVRSGTGKVRALRRLGSLVQGRTTNNSCSTESDWQHTGDDAAHNYTRPEVCRRTRAVWWRRLGRTQLL